MVHCPAIDVIIESRAKICHGVNLQQKMNKRFLNAEQRIKKYVGSS